jgi:GNAT superfamily N-acetyltransferase
VNVIRYEQGRRLTDAIVAYKLLAGMDNLYPEFSNWYTNKVMPGVLMGSDILMLARDKHQVIGVGLGKRNGHETKLRCVRVIPEYQNRSVGIHLVEQMLRALDSDRPSCTVAEEMFHQFSRPFINHFNFDLSRVEKGMYRPGKLEYVFNG